MRSFKTYKEVLLEKLVAADLAGPNTEKYVNPNNACQSDTARLKKQLWPAEAFPEFNNWNGKALIIGKDFCNVPQKVADDLNNGIKSLDRQYANSMGQKGEGKNDTNMNLLELFKGIPLLFVNSVWMWKIAEDMKGKIPRGDTVADKINRKVMDYTLKNFKGKHIFILGKDGGAIGLDLLYGTKFRSMIPLVDQIKWKGFTVHTIPHTGRQGINLFMKGSGPGVTMSDLRTKKPFSKLSKMEIIKAYIHKHVLNKDLVV